MTSSNTLQKNTYFIKNISRIYFVSSILSMMFLNAGSLVDTLIVGAYLGEEGLSAMALVGPVYLIYYTFGAIIGIGGSIVASRILGEGDAIEYKKIFTCSTITMLGVGIILTALAYGFLPSILSFLCRGVGTIQQDMARDYLVYYFPGGAMSMMAYIPFYFSRTDGKPKLSSRLYFLSAVVNIVLSLLFVSPICGMGIKGVALATSISMLMVALVGFIFLLRGKTELKFVRGSMQLERMRMLAVAGLPNGLNNLLKSARVYLINFLIIGIGASYFLSCYTVTRNVMDVMDAVISGLAYGSVPLLGVFLGERDYISLRAIMKHALRLGLLIVIPLTILACLLGGPLSRAFGITDPTLIAEGRWAIPLACIGTIAAYVNMININIMTAIKREKIATLIVSLRLFVLLAAFAIPLSYALGTKGIWMSFSLTEIFTLLVYILIRSVLRHRDGNLDKYLIDKSKEPAGDISFSVRNQVDDIVNASKLIAEFCKDNDISPSQSAKVSLAIEEILAYLTSHCINAKKAIFIDVRVSKQEDDVMLRFRYLDKPFDIKAYYEMNEDYEAMRDELLGLKIVDKSSKNFEFKQTLGCNNIVIVF